MYNLVILAFVAAVELVLGWSPKADRVTWALENAPVWIGLILLVVTRRRFPLSHLCMTLLAIHATILAVGGHWTYAKVPAGDWVKEVLGWVRNPYDRLGHIAQGFCPVILVRELLLRTSRLGQSKWLPFLSVSVCLAFSAFYELIEWWTALAAGAGANDFLGTQGDPWDTQWDMFLCLGGAIGSLSLLHRWHDRSMTAVTRV